MIIAMHDLGTFIMLYADINECDTIGCDSNAVCVDTQGSFTCVCNGGFSGNGFSCQGRYEYTNHCKVLDGILLPADINECDILNYCSEDAKCTNTPGSFQCTCMDGYFGDGFNCTGLLKDIVIP